MQATQDDDSLIFYKVPQMFCYMYVMTPVSVQKGFL